jgi:CHASE2 domain-containing sensor protein
MNWNFFRRVKDKPVKDPVGWHLTSEKGGWLSRFWNQSYKHALVALFIIMALVQVIEFMGWFEHIESSFIGTFANAHAQKVPNDLFIVEISKDDYQQLFDGKSPLDPNGVIQIISALKQLNPLAIGVDLDTSDSAWACADLTDELTGEHSKVVWAEATSEKETAETVEKERESPLTRQLALGGRLKYLDHAGIVRLPLDHEGYVRELREIYPVSGDVHVYASKPECHQKAGTNVPSTNPQDLPVLAKSTEMPAFFYSVAKTAQPDLPSPDSEPKLLNYSGDRYHFQTIEAKQLIDAVKDNQGKMQFTAKKFPEALLANLKGKRPIVLIGGDFSTPPDEYITPLGKMAGVELLANSVETELAKPIRSLGRFGLLVLDFVMGSLIVVIYFVLPKHPKAALFWSLAAIFVLPVLMAVSYFGISVFFNCFPVMFGMLLHQMYEGTEKASELREEVFKLEEKIEKLSEELEASKSSSESVGAAPLSKGQAAGK